jgi:hypothetical protein
MRPSYAGSAGLTLTRQTDRACVISRQRYMFIVVPAILWCFFLGLSLRSCAGARITSR